MFPIKKKNIFIYFLILVFFIAIIFSFLNYLKVEIINIKNLIKLIFIPAIFFILIYVNIFFKQTKRKINLFFFSTFSIIYLLEGYFHLFNKNFFIDDNYKYLIKQREFEIKKNKINFDTRTKFQVIKTNKKLKLFISPSNFLLENAEIFPLSSNTNQSILHCNDTGRYSVYKSDRYGFNNDDDIWENVVKNFIIGDSFVHGACVNQNQTISGRLNHYGYPSINLGISSIGPLIEYAILKEYLPFNENNSKKNLFWFWYEGNDINDLNRELQNKILRKYFFDSSFNQDLIHKKKALNKYLSQKESVLIKKSKFATQKKFFKLFYTRQLIKIIFIKSIYQNSDSHDNTASLTNINKVFSEILEISKKKGYKLHFFYLPSYFRLIDKKYEIKKNFEKSEIKNILFENNIYFYDFTNDIIYSNDPKRFFVFKYNTHYNKYAYDFFANKLIQLIKNNND